MPRIVKNKDGLKVSENTDFSILKQLPWEYELGPCKVSALSTKGTKGQEPPAASPVADRQVSPGQVKRGWSNLVVLQV